MMRSCTACTLSRGYIEEIHFGMARPQPYQGVDADRLLRCSKCPAPYSAHLEDRATAVHRGSASMAATTSTTIGDGVGSSVNTAAQSSSSSIPSFSTAHAVPAQRETIPVNRRLEDQLQLLSPDIPARSQPSSKRAAPIGNSTENRLVSSANMAVATGIEAALAAPARRKQVREPDSKADMGTSKRRKVTPSITSFFSTSTKASSEVAIREQLRAPPAVSGSEDASSEASRSGVDITDSSRAEVDIEHKYDDDNDKVQQQLPSSSTQQPCDDPYSTATGGSSKDETSTAPTSQPIQRDTVPAHLSQSAAARTTHSHAELEDDVISLSNDDGDDYEQDIPEDDSNDAADSSSEEIEDEEEDGDPDEQHFENKINAAYKQYNESEFQPSDDVISSSTTSINSTASRRVRPLSAVKLLSQSSNEVLRQHLGTVYVTQVGSRQFDATDANTISISSSSNANRTTIQSSSQQTVNYDNLNLPSLRQLLRHACTHKHHVCHYPSRDNSQGTYIVDTIRGHRDVLIRGKIIRRYLVYWKQDEDAHIDCVLGIDFVTPCITIQYDRIFPRGQAPHTFLATDPADVAPTAVPTQTEATLIRDYDLADFTASGNPIELNDDKPLTTTALDALLKQEMHRISRYQAKLRVRASQQVARLQLLRSRQNRFLNGVEILRTEAALQVCRSNLNILCTRLGYINRYPVYEDAVCLASSITAQIINKAQQVDPNSAQYYSEDFPVLSYPTTIDVTSSSSSSPVVPTYERPEYKYYSSLSELAVKVHTKVIIIDASSCRYHRVLAEQVRDTAAMETIPNYIWYYHRAVATTDQWFYYLAPDPDSDSQQVVTPATSATSSSTTTTTSSTATTSSSSSATTASTVTTVTTPAPTISTSTAPAVTTMTVPSTTASTTTLIPPSSMSTVDSSTVHDPNPTSSSHPPLRSRRLRRVPQASTTITTPSTDAPPDSQSINLCPLDTVMSGPYTPHPVPLLSIPSALSHTVVRQMQLGQTPSYGGYAVTPGRTTRPNPLPPPTALASTAPIATTTITSPPTSPSITTSPTTTLSSSSSSSPCSLCLEDVIQMMIHRRWKPADNCHICHSSYDSHPPRNSHPLYQSVQPVTTTISQPQSQSSQIFTSTMIADGWPLFKQEDNQNDRSTLNRSARNRPVFYDALSFMEALNRMIKTRNLPRTHWEFALLNACYDTQVQRWIEEYIVSKGLSWSRIEDIFINQFTKHDARLQWQRDYDNISMKDSRYRTVDAYAQRFIALVRRLSYSSSDISVVERMERGITDELRAELQREKQSRLLCQITAAQSSTSEVVHSTVFVFNDIYALYDTLTSLERSLAAYGKGKSSYGPVRKGRYYSRGRDSRTPPTVNKLELDAQGQPRNVNKKRKNNITK